jgi:two-component system sensor histidine kinase SenX3
VNVSTMPAEAEVLGWFDQLSNWDRWGPDDRLGTLNHVTPQHRVAAAQLVQVGESVSCSWDMRTGRQPGATVENQRYMLSTGLGLDDEGRRGLLGEGRAGGAHAPLGLHLRAVALNSTHVAVEAADVTESHRLARVRRDFVANVSHELKTPIGALQLLAEALLDATQLPESAPGAQSEDLLAARRFAERIHHESARMGRLVSELLELTRLQGAEPLPDPEPVALDWVIAEVLDRTRTTSSAKNIEVVYTGPKGVMAYGSDSQFATAVTNLVENAIAYSGPDTKVELAVRQNDEWIEIDVTDQGIGISPQDVDRIFERFYRADQARSRATGGTGLGLAIVKHIATNHGGRVDVTSALGDGSTFTLRLPARPPESPSPSSTATEIESGATGR